MQMTPFINNRYQILYQLGEGGMGMVYTAFDRLSQHDVAIKVVNPSGGEMVTQQTDGTLSLRIELAQEFKTLASLRHPNIISVLDYGFDEHRRPYYAMELIDDGDTLLKAGKDLPLEGKIDLLIQVLQALVYLHRRGIIHRDLKPANVMVTGGQVKVLDFGLAETRQMLEESGGKAAAAGTLSYMAPELFQQGVATEASDLYAVGVMAFQLLAGMHPFRAGNMGQLVQDILQATPPLESIPAPENIRQLIGSLLIKNPDDRPHDAQVVIQALADAINQPLTQTHVVRESFLQAAQFVGRKDELTHLMTALTQARAGTGSLWLVGGESGVGKSRLLDEIRTQALVKGALVLRGQAIAEGGAPYILWWDVLRYLVLQTDLTQLEASVLKTLLPDLPILLDREIPDAPEIDTMAAQNRLLMTIEGIFSRQNRLIMLVLEDLHWAVESLQVLARLQRIIPTLPLLVVASYRNDETPNLPQQFPSAQVITLERLSEAEIGQLSAAMLGEVVGRRSEIVQYLQTETEGNAFFMVEVVRALAEEAGELEHIGVATLPTRIFAHGIKTILQRRLSRVPEMARPVLEVAAILGRQVNLPVIEYLLKTEYQASGLDLTTWLSQCSDASILDVQDNRWRFSHDKLREALLDGLNETRQKELHQQAALALEATAPNDPNQYAVLAYHWGQVGETAKEGQYIRLAGQQSLQNAAYQPATLQLRRALELADALNLTTTERARLSMQLGEALLALGNLDQGQAALDVTLNLLGYTDPADPKALRRSMLRQITRQIFHIATNAVRWYNPTPEQAEALRIAALTSEHLMKVHYFVWRRESMIHSALLGVNLAEQCGKYGLAEQGRFYSGMAFGMGATGFPRLVEMYIRKGDRIIAKLNDADVTSWNLLASGIHYVATGNWAEAEHRLERCLELTRRMGHIRRWEEAAVTLAGGWYYAGKWKESDDLAKELYASGEKQGNQQALAWAYDDFARYALRLGNFDHAIRDLSKSLAIHNQAHDEVDPWILGTFAKVYLCMGDEEKTREYIALTEERVAGVKPTHFGMLEPYGVVAEYYLREAEQDPTPEKLKKARQACEWLGDYGKTFKMGEPRYKSYLGWLAYLEGKPSTAITLAEKGLKIAQDYKMHYEVGLGHYHLGYVLPKTDPRRADHLNQAIQILEGLGATWDIEQAKSALSQA